ncbi:hypothetical protein CPA40_06885 [Bifidobacterium callitrichos]|uniref:HTH tetR-type domain-containing protein n=1 Tax=Bifidobacterium callitrichos TaxID=762209 RepID=A0A2T3G9I8_9BIFI|nr:TetR/AcrR family transcriptional regulator [Bifidobacterium callitrichos]PST46166.1 hypothetical protein CPA40_06885 [Bifidobacterium callitrichos]
MENDRVRRQITEALFVLMERRRFSAITVTDIVAEAGVARASYYRNFKSKEDVINAWMSDLHDSIQPSDTKPREYDVFARANIADGFERSLTRFLTAKSYILTLYRNGFASLIQDTINGYVRGMAGRAPMGSIGQYRLYFVAGAMFNILIKWLEGGAVESPRAIAQACADWLALGVSDKPF